jgi:GT2 family glycosyltransferase
MTHLIISLVATNERDLLEKCLLTLIPDIKSSGLNTKIIIVDNASSDDIDSIGSLFPDVEILKQRGNEGFGKSHNRAMKTVPETQYFLILNPDTVFPPQQQILRRMYDFMESNPKVGICGPKLLYPDGSLQYSCCRFPNFFQPLYSRTNLGKSPKGARENTHFLMKDFDHNATVPVDWVIGSAMLVRKQAIDEVGMFDERFWMYAEDSDWCRSMWEKNWRVYYLHDVMLTHVHGRFSAKVPGVIMALLTNRYARVHLASWLKYFWKWRGTHKYYAHPF